MNYIDASNMTAAQMIEHATAHAVAHPSGTIFPSHIHFVMPRSKLWVYSTFMRGEYAISVWDYPQKTPLHTEIGREISPDNACGPKSLLCYDDADTYSFAITAFEDLEGFEADRIDAIRSAD